ncbi:ABC-2 type transport system permease protein [Rhodoblastus acidophilus]|uniref:ABC transporter permease n=1 Tax=Rhodoblastus acidophilus TaxID=1074 RepID=UPI0022244C52|nr:ABC transporter permease [Rhodoblastus acidophilus]MCW2286200.1 ABC-2 type transport system permease protein [Rhodoblastus acidophilus]MCW2335118.1 ABC-2 type transport system permease protein [Rhodoblastus acidophilus]
MQTLRNIFWLGAKELRSFFRDFVLLGLVLYSFSLAILAQAQSHAQELHNAAIAVADEDHSELSRRLARAFLPPYFLPAKQVSAGDIDRLMDVGAFTFILDIPPNFERDFLAGRRPTVQVNVDATAMMQAGVGAGYIEQILTAELAKFATRQDNPAPASIGQTVRIAFNPNLITSWFSSVMGIISSTTMLAIILAGAAVVREREHGTVEHLLVMPVTPFEIAMAKIWANGLIILGAVALSLTFVVQRLLAIPINGSVPLFLLGAALYLFFATSVGVFLATIARTMPQLGLLYLLVAVPLNLLSGANTPLESMPALLRNAMLLSPSTHFVAVAQAVLYRGAGFDLIWERFLAMGAIGGFFLILSVWRFRSVSAQNG